MTKNDEHELHRLTNLLSKIGDKAELSEDGKEALRKAAIALSVSFIHGHRKEIEEIYCKADEKLSAEQQQHLRALGLKNG
jgi:hypothetical protein